MNAWPWRRALRRDGQEVVWAESTEPGANADEDKTAQLEQERDQLIARLNVLVGEYDQLSCENRELRQRARESEPPDIVQVRRDAAQDRRNCLVLSDALASAEGRRCASPGALADLEVVSRLHREVRATVAEVLGVQLEAVR